MENHFVEIEDYLGGMADEQARRHTVRENLRNMNHDALVGIIMGLNEWIAELDAVANNDEVG
jgi:hypothetical protein